jgi:8-amino-7-oxononanoate synthase
LSKALASEGGFVAGKSILIDFLINRARSFIFSTALAPATIAVSLKALEIVRNEPELRETLLSSARWFRERLRFAGFSLVEGATPIISVLIGDSDVTVRFSNELLKQGIYVSAIRPPTVPPGTSRLRISIMAAHTRADLEAALERLETIGRELGVLKKDKL